MSGSVAAAWAQALSHAQYLLLTHGNSRRIAWSPSLRAYFRSHFRLVYASPKNLVLYVREG